MNSSLETGRFSGAAWIWPVNHHWDVANSYALFRKRFELERIPGKAPLFVTADQSYRLFVNGEFVCRGPARGFQRSWPYDEVDIGPFLRRGTNVIAVRAHHPGRSTFQYRTEGFAGLLVAAKWGAFRLVSDPDWKSIREASASRDTVQASMQLFNQEHIDLRLGPVGWMEEDFDDASWEAPAARPWNAPPWTGLEPRGIPLLREEEIAPGLLIGVGSGRSAEGYERVRDVVALRYREDRSHRPAPDRSLPLKVELTGPGGFRSYLLDFGRTVVGHFVCEMRGAAGGEIIDTHYAESIDAATLTPDYDPAAHSKPAIGDRLVCRAGDASHLFYHPCGFRYAMVTVRDVPAPFEIGLRFRRIGYPLERKGSFSSSDPALEKIWEACVRTQECCSLDAYVDTPWREQAQWWGDARVQAWNTFHIDGDVRLFRRGIRQIALQTTFDGLTYGHSPTMGHECVLPDFTLIWLLTLWDDYWQTGETDLFAAHHEAIQTALGYFRGKADPKSGLVPYDDRYWLFLDWTDLFRDGVPAVYNLWLLIALEKTASLYRKVRRPLEAAPLEAWAGRLRRSLEGLVDRRGLVRDGIDRKGCPVPQTSLHAQTLAIAAGLRGVDIPRAVGTLFLPFLRGEIRPKSDPSAYWITYIFSLMGSLGHGAEVVSCIRRRWLPMAEYGTTWENWAPKPGHESHSHAWSAHPLFHLMQTVGGIVQTAPAWREVDFRPVFHGEKGGASVPTPRGTIVSEWKRAGAAVEVSLRVPHGVKARAHLPRMRPRTIAGGGCWTVVCGEA